MAGRTASGELGMMFAHEMPDVCGNPAYYFVKRALDVIGASLLLVLVWPFMLLVALLIKIDSPGPAFFVQSRVGCRRRRNGDHGQTTWCLTTFPFYKFRSMHQGASDSMHREFIREFCSGTNGSSVCAGEFKLKDDTRVTAVGRLLRKTSLDELPQLFNVLKGDMSLVGPRPVPTYEVAMYSEQHYERFSALPGITGLWQVKGRSEVPFEDMIRMDVEYVRNISIWQDVKILLLTIPAVLSAKGAQ